MAVKKKFLFVLLCGSVYASTDIPSGEPIQFLGPLLRSLQSLMAECKVSAPLAENDDTTCDEFLLRELILSFYHNPHITPPTSSKAVLQIIDMVAHNSNVAVQARRNFYRALLLAWLPEPRGWTWFQYGQVFSAYAEHRPLHRGAQSEPFLTQLKQHLPHFNFYDVETPKALIYRATQYLGMLTNKNWTSLTQSWHLDHIMPLEHLTRSSIQLKMAHIMASWDTQAMLTLMQGLQSNLRSWSQRLSYLDGDWSEIDSVSLASASEEMERMAQLQKELATLQEAAVKWDAQIEQLKKDGHPKHTNKVATLQMQQQANQQKVGTILQKLSQYHRETSRAIRRTITRLHQVINALLKTQRERLKNWQKRSAQLKGDVRQIPPEILTINASNAAKAAQIQSQLQHQQLPSNKVSDLTSQLQVYQKEALEHTRKNTVRIKALISILQHG